jgi:hypothetical protein
MDREELLKNMEETFEKCLETAKLKNQDYANDLDCFSNFSSIEELGITKTEIGFLVRMQDKWSRIINLINKKNSVEDETIDDTIEDFINYLALLKAYRRSKYIVKFECIKCEKSYTSDEIASNTGERYNYCKYCWEEEN